MKFAVVTLFFALSALITSCTDVIKVVSSENAESSYCTTRATFSSSYTITGIAKYQKRLLDSSGLGAIDSTTYPIRRAEVQVLDSNGSTVQCTETDASGNYSFTIPQGGKTYTVKILSRSYNSYNKASVLNNPTDNTPYYISQSFTADSSKALTTLTASAANSDLKAAAYNILDRIYDANDFLLNNTSSFTVSAKVQAYWTKGVNPVTFFDSSSTSGVSFYVPGTNRLYILGGQDGDVTVEDTDHFDDAVIVHEFGHFVEDNYSESDSPGGTHYGLYVVDPRLAWSEGFATFFQTQVNGSPLYRDTIGIGNGYGYYYDASNINNTNNSSTDSPTAGSFGEGNFRELVVVRSLWSAINDYSMPFSEFWSVYTGTFKSTTPFREMSLFLQKQAAQASPTSISGMFADDDKELDATRRYYGTVDESSTPDNTSSAACQWTIDPADPVPVGSGTFEKSNQYYSNDFFYYYHSGGTLSVALSYMGSGADLDIYVYKDGYEFGVGSDLQAYSNADANNTCADLTTHACTESISSSVPAGYYMINIMYYNATAAKANATYTLTVNSNVICK